MTFGTIKPLLAAWRSDGYLSVQDMLADAEKSRLYKTANIDAIS